MCEAPEFHQGPRPFFADCHAHFSTKPRAISFLARVRGRFHRRQIRLRLSVVVEGLSGARTFVALGYGGQFILIIPDLELAIVATSRISGSATERFAHYGSFFDLVDNYIISAVRTGETG